MPTPQDTEPVDDDLDDDICSDPFDEGCAASLNDGEGYDGACGNCADRIYGQEHDDDEEICA